MKIIKARQMPEDRRKKVRFLTIIIKWMVLATSLVYVMAAGLWAILFYWVPWLLQYNWRLMMEYMDNAHWVRAYLQRTGLWWTVAIILLILLVAFEWATHYRHKRRDLLINGVSEGRVVWIKGVRQGLLYDFWDAYNYIQWVRGKKKERGSKTPVSPGAGQVPGTVPLRWPNPWAIPIGAPVIDAYVVYLKRGFWQLIPDICIIPVGTPLRISFFAYSLPLVRWRRVPNRGLSFFFGWTPRWVYLMTMDPLERFLVDPALGTQANRQLLNRSRTMIRDAIESDPETVKADYERGSVRVPTLGEEPGKYD